MDRFFFDGWVPLLRTALIGLLAYVGLIVLLRASGKRTLSKMNAFDLVVTVALGSTMATVLLSKDVSLAQGLVGFAMLVGMQFVVTWLSVRFTPVHRLVTGEPVMLVYNGAFQHAAMRRSRVRADEVRAAVRAQGAADLNQVRAVVLETDGSFSIVRDDDRSATGEDLGERSSLAGVDGPGSDGRTDRA